MSESFNKPHTLTLDNRKRLCLTGVEDVPVFNEENVSVTTSMGALIIGGSSLRIDRLSLETGEVEINGEISSLRYSAAKGRKSLVQRLLS